MDLGDFVRVYDRFDPLLCDKTIDLIKDRNWIEHTFRDAKTGEVKSLSGDKELEVLHDVRYTDYDLILRGIESSLKQYVTHLKMPWFTSLQKCSQIRFNRYKKGTMMATHCDHIHSLFDGEEKGIPILSIVGALNDDYDGGELIILDQTIKLKKGQIVIFPSNFLYPHHVNEVTEGTRYTFVSWAW